MVIITTELPTKSESDTLALLGFFDTVNFESWFDSVEKKKNGVAIRYGRHEMNSLTLTYLGFFWDTANFGTWPDSNEKNCNNIVAIQTGSYGAMPEQSGASLIEVLGHGYLLFLTGRQQQKLQKRWSHSIWRPAKFSCSRLHRHQLLLGRIRTKVSANVSSPTAKLLYINTTSFATITIS